MADERSKRAVDVAIAFGEGKATREELDAARTAAWAAARAAEVTGSFFLWVAAYAAAEACAAYAAYGAYAASSSWAGGNFDEVAKKQNQKQTAEICRKYLPLEIWDQNLI